MNFLEKVAKTLEKKGFKGVRYSCDEYALLWSFEDGLEYYGSRDFADISLEGIALAMDYGVRENDWLVYRD